MPLPTQRLNGRRRNKPLLEKGPKGLLAIAITVGIILEQSNAVTLLVGRVIILSRVVGNPHDSGLVAEVIRDSLHDLLEAVGVQPFVIGRVGADIDGRHDEGVRVFLRKQGGVYAGADRRDVCVRELVLIPKGRVIEARQWHSRVGDGFAADVVEDSLRKDGVVGGVVETQRLIWSVGICLPEVCLSEYVSCCC